MPIKHIVNITLDNFFVQRHISLGTYFESLTFTSKICIKSVITDLSNYVMNTTINCNKDIKVSGSHTKH